MVLIDRKKLEEQIKEAFKENPGVMGMLLHWIRRQKAVDAVPVVHGEWIAAYPDIEPNPMFMYGICSVCGFEQSLSDKLNYCPNCGAKMRGTEDE